MKNIQIPSLNKMANISLEEFHQDFTQSVLHDAESRGLMKSQAFFEIVCEDLNSIGDLTNNYTYGEYIKKGIEAYGYDFDDERRILTILNHHYFQEDNIQTLTRNQIDIKIARMKAFYNKSIQGLYTQMEETSEAYSMAFNIFKYHQKNKIDKVRMMVLSDGKATRSLKELPSEKNLEVQFDFRVIDIEYLYKIYTSQTGNGEFAIQVDLPFLKVNNEQDPYQSFLSVVTGNLLVDIYEKHGQKLFEQNVRTFLQFRGAVNKGLRNTIEDKPEMFFAYNNGITATATSIEIGPNGNISLIKNFQIVNGGQTTSAIYAANKVSRIDVSRVSVQMKLSVVKDPNKQDIFISKVAEYANTQNKINNSDFFSNSPFHKDIKEYSTRIYAPAIDGLQRRTHWYYERVRGEYLNSQAYLSPDEKRKFQIENPKNQVVDKTLLSKTENVWQQMPDVVSRGAQDSFKKFAERITELIEKDNLAITESYFKDSISRVILFRTVEKLVTNAHWYDGGFRAQTVAYTIAYLSFLVERNKMFLNFNLIWEKQKVPENLIVMLETIAEKVYLRITQPPAGFANITQWAKTAGCWDIVKQLKIEFGEVDSSLFTDYEEQKYILKEVKKNKEIDLGINVQVQVLNTKTEDWKKLHNYYSQDKSSLKLSSMQSDILNKMAKGLIPLASEKQAAVLYNLINVAKKEGLAID